MTRPPPLLPQGRAANAAIARAQEALRSADEGAGLMSAEDFLSGMELRAKDAQRRIREAVSARNKRAAG